MNKLKDTTCYLAGPVELVDDCVSWRNALTPLLKNLGVNVWDPLNKPEWFVDRVGNLTPQDQRNDKLLLNNIVSDQLLDYQQIMEAKDAGKRNDYVRKVCLRLVSACDFVICRVAGPTIGTFEEICIANQQNKPILFLSNNEDLDSCWRAAQFGNLGDDPRLIWFKSQDFLMDYLTNIDNGTELVNNLDWIFLKETGWTQ